MVRPRSNTHRSNSDSIPVSASTRSSKKSAKAKTRSTKSKQKEQDLDGRPTALYNGVELLIVTNAVRVRVQDSQVQALAEVIMPWHPSHSSQRNASKYKSIFQLISEKTWKKAHKGTSASSSYTYYSLYDRNPWNWGEHKKRKRSGYSLLDRLPFSGSSSSNNINLNWIVAGVISLAMVSLMIALYLDNDEPTFNRHDPTTHSSQVIVPKPVTDPQNHHRASSSSSRTSRSSISKKERERKYAEIATMEEKYLMEREARAATQLTRELNPYSDDGDDENDDSLGQLVVHDRGIPIRYDLNEEAITVFKAMRQRTKLDNEQLATIANTDRQFVLAAAGDEVSSSLAGSLIDVLLCNKPQYRGDDFDELLRLTEAHNKLATKELWDSMHDYKRKEFQRHAEYEQEFIKMRKQKRKHIMSGAPIFGNDKFPIPRLYMHNTIRADLREQELKLAEEEKKRNAVLAGHTPDPKKREGYCVAVSMADLRQKPPKQEKWIYPYKIGKTLVSVEPNPNSPYHEIPYVQPELQQLGEGP